MTSGPVAASNLRDEVMDFSFPYYMDIAALVYKHDAQPTLKSFLFLRPYKWQVWVCICIVVPCISVIIYSFYHAITFMNNKYRLQSSFLKTFWSVLGLTFRNGKLLLSII